MRKFKHNTKRARTNWKFHLPNAVSGRELLLLERTNLKQSIMEEEIVKILAGIYHSTRKWNTTKHHGRDQNKHIRSPRIANFPLVKASSLDLQHSRRRLRTDLSLLVVEERPFCRGKRKRSFYTEITSREFNATEKHAARIAQKQWRQDFLFTWRTPDKNKPSDWSVWSLNRPRA